MVTNSTLPSVNTHLPTPHLPALIQAHDLCLADASDFSQGWEGWIHESITRYAEVGVGEVGVGCVAGVFLWGGLDNLIEENDEECRCDH